MKHCLLVSISSLLIIHTFGLQYETECRYLEKYEEDLAGGYIFPPGCYKNTQNESYGLFCVSEVDGVSYADGAMIEYKYPAQNCPNPLLNENKIQIGDVYNCSEENCICTEGLSGCDYMTIRYYDTDSWTQSCVTDKYTEYQFVKDFCQNRSYGSYHLECVQDGEIDGWQSTKYKQGSCSGDLYTGQNPVGPTESLCTLTACSGGISSYSPNAKTDNGGDNGSTVGIVVAIVLILLALIGCGVAYYCYRGRNRKRVQVGFDESADRGDLKNDEVGFYETNTYETNDRL